MYVHVQLYNACNNDVSVESSRCSISVTDNCITVRLGPSQAHERVSIASTAALQAAQRSSATQLYSYRSTQPHSVHARARRTYMYVRTVHVLGRHVRGAALVSLGNFEEARGTGEVLTLGACVHLPLGRVRVDDLETLATTTTTTTNYVICWHSAISFTCTRSPMSDSANIACEVQAPSYKRNSTRIDIK